MPDTRSTIRHAVLLLALAFALGAALASAAQAQLRLDSQVLSHRGNQLSSNPGGPETFTFNYALPAADNRALLVVVFSEYFVDGRLNNSTDAGVDPNPPDGTPDDRATLSVTYGGVPFTLLAQQENEVTSLVKNNRMWVGLIPESGLSTGSAPLQVTYGAGPDDGFGAAIYVLAVRDTLQTDLPTTVPLRNGCRPGGAAADIVGGGVIDLPAVTGGSGDLVVAVAGNGDSNPQPTFPNDPLIIQPDGTQVLTTSGPGFSISTIVYDNTTAGDVVFDDSITLQDGCNNRPVQFQVVFTQVVRAFDDRIEGVRGDIGGDDVLDVRAATPPFGPDLIGGDLATAANSTISVVTPAAPIGGGPVPALGADGFVDVPAGTPPGTYDIVYELCDIPSGGNRPNCSQATATLVVTTGPTVDAQDDGYGLTTPLTAPLPGQPADVQPVTALANDAFDPDPGTPGADPADAGAGGNVTLTLAAGQAAPGPGQPFLVLSDGTAGGGGAAVPPGASPGEVIVPPGTPAGTYTIRYTLTEAVPGSPVADDATVTVVVGPPDVNAEDDAFAGLTSAAGGQTGSVLTNDDVDGIPASADVATLTQRAGGTGPGGAPLPAGLALVTDSADADFGTITVPPGTPAGIYTLPYTLCDAVNAPPICDDAVATVTVDPSPIAAGDDTFASGTPAADTALPVSALANDSLGGTAGPDPADVVLTAPAPPGPGDPPVPYVVADGATGPNGEGEGTVIVPAGTPASPPGAPYAIPYDICEAADPDNCASAVIEVTVTAASIVAADDDYTAIPVPGGPGGTVPGVNVRSNDLLGGTAGPAPAAASVAAIASDPDTGAATDPQLSLNPDGTVAVAPGTPAGTYTLAYELCDLANPGNCDTATVTVAVTAGTIAAAPDVATRAAPLSGPGAVVDDVLATDLLNGAAPTPADVVVTAQPATSTTGPTPDTVPFLVSDGDAGPFTEGAVVIPPGTPAGTYAIPYRICETLNPANCATSTATVIVPAPPIQAADDDFTGAPVNGAAGGPAGNVLGNDTLASAAAQAEDVTITVTDAAAPLVPGRPVPALDPATGDVTVPPGTPPGDYVIAYRLCETLNPDNCDAAGITVRVSGPGGERLVDDESLGNLPGSAVTLRVVDNDEDPNGTLAPGTLRILGTDGPGAALTVAGQGTWTPDPAAGTIAFTAEDGFNGDPTPIRYDFQDLFGRPVASATVIVTFAANASFQCADVIGKVFDDRDADGRQDEGEAGLPAARLRTPDGLVITADAQGRFSVPCAALPRRIGSTFLLELDPRSLPTGYRVVTANPATVRLTPGTMRRLNFGATLSDVVNVDLTAAAFDAEGRPTERLEEGLAGLVAAIAGTPSTVRLRYFVDDAGEAAAGVRLDAVEDRLRALWRGAGRYQLNLERTLIVRD